LKLGPRIYYVRHFFMGGSFLRLTFRCELTNLDSIKRPDEENGLSL